MTCVPKPPAPGGVRSRALSDGSSGRGDGEAMRGPDSRRTPENREGMRGPDSRKTREMASAPLCHHEGLKGFTIFCLGVAFVGALAAAIAVFLDACLAFFASLAALIACSR